MGFGGRQDVWRQQITRVFGWFPVVKYDFLSYERAGMLVKSKTTIMRASLQTGKYFPVIFSFPSGEKLLPEEPTKSGCFLWDLYFNIVNPPGMFLNMFWS